MISKGGVRCIAVPDDLRLLVAPALYQQAIEILPPSKPSARRPDERRFRTRWDAIRSTSLLCIVEPVSWLKVFLQCHSSFAPSSSKSSATQIISESLPVCKPPVFHCKTGLITPQISLPELINRRISWICQRAYLIVSMKDCARNLRDHR